MKLTPLDIRQKEFRRAMRGYSDEEVDVFLDEVADEFERLFQENIDAQERIERLQEQLAHYDGLKETLQKTLITAQQQADELKANSHKEGELILRDAELRSRDILSESYAEKQRVQQSLMSLRQVEEDFRFKFKSLLEAHLNLLNEDESSEERRRFRGLVDGVAAVEAGAAGVDAAPAALAVDAPAETGGDESAPVVLVPGDEPANTVSPVALIVDTDTGLDAAASATSAVVGDDPAEEAPPSFLVRSTADEEPFAFDLESDDDVTDAEGVAGGTKEIRSPVRRFLFGKKDAGSDDDLFTTKKDRDFEW